MSATSPLLPEAQAALDTAPLWRRWRDGGDAMAREELIRHHMPFARMVAATVFARRTHGDVEFDDYLQLASIGLIESVDRFDPAQGVQFRTFASKRVQGAVLNGLVRLTEKNQQISARTRLGLDRLAAVKEAAEEEAAGTSSPARAERLFRYLAEVGVGLALGYMLEETGMISPRDPQDAPQLPSPEVSYFRKTETQQLRALLRNLVDQLPEQQKVVIRYHYQQEIPFDEIARAMGVTRGRISQLHRLGLRRLQELLAGEPRRDLIF
jgi:RNA polymerase sigma factor for flagellar operon FliA